jgi:hypothetical protein
VLDLLRQHFSDADSVFVCPHVPPAKEQAARRVHAAHLPAAERILVLHDATPFGGHEGFVVTAERICWKNAGETACSIEWRSLEPDRLYLDGHWLFLGEDAIALREIAVQDACANAFHVLALSGRPPQSFGDTTRDTVPDLGAAKDSVDSGVVPHRARTGTKRKKKKASSAVAVEQTSMPPPALSHVAYAPRGSSEAQPDCSCWHCYSPLYATAPRCPYCGAEPKPTGWLRTG